MPTPLRLLLVEDSEDDAKLLLMELRRGGWDVTHKRVESAHTLVAALSEGPWDFIISDYSMPQFTGVAALAIARERAPETPFMLISGTVGEETAVQAMKAGANDYLFKGNLYRLSPAVARELREAEIRRAARRTAHNLHLRDKQLIDAQKLARLGTWHLRIAANTVTASEETFRILGFEPRDDSSTYERFFAAFHEDDRKQFVESLNMAEVKQFAHDYRILHPDGLPHFVHVRADVTRDAQGKSLEAAGMIQDITERKLAEEALRKANDELAVAKEAAEAASRAKDNFLAMLSHELRTPLTPVLVIVSQMESLQDLDAELRNDLTTVRCNVELEARLIDDLLDMTRIARNKVELHFEVVDVHEVAQMSLQSFQAEIDAKGLQVQLSLGAAQRHVWADPRRIQQVFMNLLSNAVKFTPEGGTIVLSSKNNEHGYLQVQVSDTGIGIEPDVMPRLFNSFEQAEHAIHRKYGGLGLGLSIAKSLVEMQGARIYATSDGRDKGTTLSVELEPVHPLNRPPTPADDAPPAMSITNGARGRRVLLVEDHSDTRRVMARIIKSFGYTVAAVACAREALELADKETFDLLVSDIGLPDGTGLEVMRCIRARYPIKGIAVSGFGQDEDLRRSQEAGFEKHLTKPINFRTLQNVIEKLAG